VEQEKPRKKTKKKELRGNSASPNCGECEKVEISVSSERRGKRGATRYTVVEENRGIGR